MISYINAMLGSTAIIASVAQRFYEGFDIQSPTQLAAYSLIGAAIGIAISKSCDRKVNSKLEMSINNQK